MKKDGFEIEFIMGTRSARIVDHGSNTHLDIGLEETVTEQNFARVFSELVDALIQSGKLKNGDVLCTTFPAGARRIDNPAVN